MVFKERERSFQERERERAVVSRERSLRETVKRGEARNVHH